MDDIIERIWAAIRDARIERGDNRFDDNKVNTVILGPAAYVELRSSKEACEQRLLQMFSDDGKFWHYKIFDARIVIDVNLGPDSHTVAAGYMLGYGHDRTIQGAG